MMMLSSTSMMHLIHTGSLALFWTTTSFAADGLRPRDAIAACSSIAKQISGASQVYYAGLALFHLLCALEMLILMF